ncbi:MAG: LysR family transcriptional regulator [Parachlamydia sp.]|nr:LysR family transcriptional regulator [Parachlamydia sp.]
MHSMINLQHLKFFYDTVILKSVSEAAKKNFVTQSTISQGISKLEKTFGILLVTHSRSHFQITQEGMLVFEHAKSIFKSIHAIQEEVHRCKGHVGGDLNFVCTNSLGMSFIDQAFKKMQEVYPQVKLMINLGGLHHIRTSLVQGLAEIGIILYDNSFANFNKVTLTNGKFHIYKSIHAKQNNLTQGILVDHHKGTYVEDLLSQGFKIHAAVGGWEVVARFTDQCFGVGFFPDYILRGNRYPNLVPHSIDIPTKAYEICAIFPKGHNLSTAATAFIELLKAI